MNYPDDDDYHLLEPLDDMDAVPQLKRDLAYEIAHWDACAEAFCTDFTQYNKLLAEIVGFVPNSRVNGSGGDDPDEVIKNLLRGLPVKHRVIVEYRYGLWGGPGYSARVVAGALGLAESTVEKLRGESLDLLQVHRDRLLLQLARASEGYRPD